jgi:hypothetical protein
MLHASRVSAAARRTESPQQTHRYLVVCSAMPNGMAGDDPIAAQPVDGSGVDV